MCRASQLNVVLILQYTTIVVLLTVLTLPVQYAAHEAENVDISTIICLSNC